MNVIILSVILSIASNISGSAIKNELKEENLARQNISTVESQSAGKYHVTNTTSVTVDEISTEGLVPVLKIFSNNNYQNNKTSKQKKKSASKSLSKHWNAGKRFNYAFNRIQRSKPYIFRSKAKPNHAAVRHSALKHHNCQNSRLSETRINTKKTTKPQPHVEREPECLKGFVQKDGKCIQLPLELMVDIPDPNQCPRGYKADQRGYCRMLF